MGVKPNAFSVNLFGRREGSNRGAAPEPGRDRKTALAITPTLSLPTSFNENVQKKRCRKLGKECSLTDEHDTNHGGSLTIAAARS